MQNNNNNSQIHNYINKKYINSDENTIKNLFRKEHNSLTKEWNNNLKKVLIENKFNSTINKINHYQENLNNSNDLEINFEKF